jgi:uncharacterized membrane protein YczE
MDFTAWLLHGFSIPSYAGQLLLFALGIVVTAIGLMLYLTCDLVVMPVEALNNAIAFKLKIPFYKVKTVMDCVYVALAIAVMLIGMGKTENIREGTVIAAMIGGKLYAYFHKILSDWELSICYGPERAAEIKKAFDVKRSKSRFD